jgi:hypothetical protein
MKLIRLLLERERQPTGERATSPYDQDGDTTSNPSAVAATAMRLS